MRSTEPSRDAAAATRALCRLRAFGPAQPSRA